MYIHFSSFHFLLPADVTEVFVSQCPTQYRKASCCYPDKCGINLLEEFRIRKYKLCSEANYFPGVPQYVSLPVSSTSAEGNTTETTDNGVVAFTDRHGGELSSSDDDFSKEGKTVYHNDLPNVTAKETFVEDFDFDDYRKANSQASGEGRVQYLVTNLNGEDSGSPDENSTLGPVRLRNDSSNGVKRY